MIQRNPLGTVWSCIYKEIKKHSGSRGAFHNKKYAFHNISILMHKFIADI